MVGYSQIQAIIAGEVDDSVVDDSVVDDSVVDDSVKRQFYFLKDKLSKSKHASLTADETNRLDRLIDELDQMELANNQSDQQKLTTAMKAIKLLIARLDSIDSDSKLLTIFRNNGLYRMLYHRPKLKGVLDTGVMPQLLKTGIITLGVAALAVALFAAVSFFAAPVWLTVIATTLFAASMTYLSAILYGVVNDLFAAKSNLPYFLLGHQPQQKSLLPTNNAAAQGIAWGIAATHGPALLASIVFGIATAITASLVPFATFVFPIMMIAMPLIAVGAHFYAKRKAKEKLNNGAASALTWEFTGLNDYQKKGLSTMCPTNEAKASWLANSDRNMFGFTKVPLIGLGALAAIITLSSVHFLLPAVLFSATIATVMPLAFAAVAIVALVVAGVYAYVKRNKQTDDRFKLDFDNAQPNQVDALYLDDALAAEMRLIEVPINVASSAAPIPSPTDDNVDVDAFFTPLFKNIGLRLGDGGLQNSGVGASSDYPSSPS